MCSAWRDSACVLNGRLQTQPSTRRDGATAASSNVGDVRALLADLVRPKTLLCLYSALVYTIGKRCTCQKGQLSRFLVSASAAAPGRKAKSRSVSVSEFPLPRSQPPSCVMIQVKPSLEISIGTNVAPREKMAQRSLIGPTAVNSLSFGFWFLADRRREN